MDFCNDNQYHIDITMITSLMPESINAVWYTSVFSDTVTTLCVMSFELVFHFEMHTIGRPLHIIEI